MKQSTLIKALKSLDSDFGAFNKSSNASIANIANVVWSSANGTVIKNTEQAAAKIESMRLVEYAQSSIKEYLDNTANATVFAHMSEDQIKGFWTTLRRCVRLLVMPDAVLTFKSQGKNAKESQILASDVLGLGSYAFNSTAAQMTERTGEADGRATNSGTKGTGTGTDTGARLPESQKPTASEDSQDTVGATPAPKAGDDPAPTPKVDPAKPSDDPYSAKSIHDLLADPIKAVKLVKSLYSNRKVLAEAGAHIAISIVITDVELTVPKAEKPEAPAKAPAKSAKAPAKSAK